MKQRRNTECWTLQIYGAFLCFQSYYIPGDWIPRSEAKSCGARWTVKLEIKEDQIWHTLYQIILENIRVVISFWKVMLLSLYLQGGSQNSQNPTREDKISITLFSRRLYQFCKMLCMLQVMNIGFSLDLHWF